MDNQDHLPSLTEARLVEALRGGTQPFELVAVDWEGAGDATGLLGYLGGAVLAADEHSRPHPQCADRTLHVLRVLIDPARIRATVAHAHGFQSGFVVHLEPRPQWLDEAYRIAASAHDGDVDKAGVPYITHPVRVARMVADHGPEFEAAAVLHDTIEDTVVTVEHLRSAGIPERVVDAVEVLTHHRGERRDAYCARVAANPVALVVKRADIVDNSNPERLALLDVEVRERLTAKYARDLAALGQ